MSVKHILLFFLSLITVCNQIIAQTTGEELPSHTVKKTSDFSVSGDGTAENWQETEWTELTQRSNHANVSELQTKVKVLYSDKGLYFLFHSEDKILNATFDRDFEELWREDVVEVFLWTDPSGSDYFEYEISPLNYELPLIVSNVNGELLHWIPFANSYRGDRKIRHKTTVTNGSKESGSTINSWTAEFFIPFKLLHPLKNIYPGTGTEWKVNMYRIDYDDGTTHWSWSPYRTNFHDYEQFGIIRFE